MRRKAYAQGAAAVCALTLALAGCTGSGDGVQAEIAEPGVPAATASPAPSGDYRTLPEPCSALSENMLEELLPGTEDESEEAAEEALAGEAALTYDADRRAGCTWQRADDEGGHELQLDFERVVSYDPEVSDEEQAAKIYLDKADELGIRLRSSTQPELPDKAGAAVGATGTAEASPSPTGEAGDEGEGDGGSDGGDASAGDGDEGVNGDETESLPDAEYAAPRVLDEVGDEAFLDDRLAASSTARRDVTVVFRTSNVIVTVQYNRWLTDEQATPDSAELQPKAEEVAESLAGLLSD